MDLGCDPAPHELVAVARDARGKEVGRVRQWVNRPRANAEAAFVLEPGRGDRGRIARLTWRSLTAENPRAVTVTFDEKPVRVTDPARIEVPPHDPRTVHVLRAVLEFDGNVRATAEAIFGGPRSAEAVTEMTAVAVVLEKGSAMPPAEQLTGWFERDGVPLEVAAVEEGPFDVVFVAEGSALEPFRKAYQSRKDPFVPELPVDLGYRFLWPVPQVAAQKTMLANIYPITSRFTPVDGTIGWFGTRRLEWPAFSRKGQRIADAVAVAGLAAAEQERRRAVVLLLGPDAEDGSLLTPGGGRELPRPPPGAAPRLVDRPDPHRPRPGAGQWARRFRPPGSSTAPSPPSSRASRARGSPGSRGRGCPRRSSRPRPRPGSVSRAEGYFTSQKQWA